MSTQDIVKTEVERGNPGADWRMAYAQIMSMIQQPQHRVVRSNNSLFIITNNGNHTANFMMCNADPVGIMPKSIKEFYAAMKGAGFTKLFYSTPRSGMIKLSEKTGFKNTIVSRSLPLPGYGKPIINVEVDL
jgi:hypothetical protein